jgi:hypothetical protein
MELVDLSDADLERLGKAIVLVQGGFVGGSGSESSPEEGW